MTDTEEILNDYVAIIASNDEDYRTGSNNEYDPIMSNEGRRMMEIIFFVALSGAVSVVGSLANIINITIFIRQGFNDSVNISLLGLAISDLGALLTLIWMSICFNPLFRYSNINFDSVQVQYLTAGWPHVCFARVTSWITAFITFERCVCIALPMKVKSIITPKRTIISIIAIFMIMFACVSPVFCSIHIASTVDQFNISLYGLGYDRNGPALENISFSITVFAQLSSFIIVVVCTVTLIHNLFAKSQWRRRATVASLSRSDSTSSRDKRVMKMVTFISCIFIACFLPSAVNLILMINFSPGYSIVGRYQNSFQVSWSVLNTIEAINSSVNILVYFNMSSKFRAGFKELFGQDTFTSKVI